MVPVWDASERDSGVDDLPGLLKHTGIIWALYFWKFGYRLPKGIKKGVLSGWLPRWAKWET